MGSRQNHHSRIYWLKVLKLPAAIYGEFSTVGNSISFLIRLKGSNQAARILCYLKIRVLQEGGSISSLLRRWGISSHQANLQTLYFSGSFLFCLPCQDYIYSRNLLSDTAISLQVLPYLNLLEQNLVSLPFCCDSLFF